MARKRRWVDSMVSYFCRARQRGQVAKMWLGFVAKAPEGSGNDL